MAKVAGFVFLLEKRVLVITFKVRVYRDEWEPIVI